MSRLFVHSRRLLCLMLLLAAPAAAIVFASARAVHPPVAASR